MSAAIQRQRRQSCYTNVHNDGCHQLHMKLNTFVFTNHQADTVKTANGSKENLEELQARVHKDQTKH